MNRTLRNLSIVAAIASVALCAALVFADVGGGVSRTKHNLSSSGPGPIKVAGEKEVCKFCHTPHQSNPIGPLWNRTDPGTYYQTYSSSTLQATVSQPTGSSRLCLSCHDGTIALSQTYNSRNAPTGSIYISSGDRGYIGTDLRDDHPISFKYTASLVTAKGGELRNPSTLPVELRLDPEGRLQCTTCHNAHDDRFGKFLTMDNSGAAMCTTCHVMNEWPGNSHATSGASLSRALRDKWDNLKAASVRQASCEGCHRPHTAGGRQRLLRHEAEEDNCLSCHDGTVAAKNIDADLKKFSRHPVSSTTGVHDPTEKARSMSKHVECADCHDPHRSRSTGTASAPLIKPAMYGVSGATANGSEIKQATNEYEVCYKCHAASAVRDPLVDRVLISTDVSEEFSTTNASYHPIEARGKSSSVPSLRQGINSSTIIHCTDCHDSDTAATGAKGPHGLRYRPLLAREYVTTDGTSESPAAYALCYGCHKRSSILGDKSFEKHKKHIQEERTPCSVCHDPHGVPSSGASGAGLAGTHLINFDRKVVSASESGAGPTFADTGNRRGSCTLKCHNSNHEARTYD